MCVCVRARARVCVCVCVCVCVLCSRITTRVYFKHSLEREADKECAQASTKHTRRLIKNMMIESRAQIAYMHTTLIAIDSAVQYRFAILSQRISVGTFTDQQLADFKVPDERREVQRCPTIFIPLVDLLAWKVVIKFQHTIHAK